MWRPLRKFRNSIPCTTPQSLTDAHCWSAEENARLGRTVNIARCKIPSRGKSPRKCIRSTPAHETGKHFRPLRIGDKKTKKEETTGRKCNGLPYCIGGHTNCEMANASLFSALRSQVNAHRRFAIGHQIWSSSVKGGQYRSPQKCQNLPKMWFLATGSRHNEHIQMKFGT